MSYDLSFDKKSASLLSLCILVIAVLFVAAGFLLGVRHGLQSAHYPVEVLKAPVLPPAPRQAELQAKPVSPAAAPSSSASAASPATEPVLQAEPAPESALTLQFGAFSQQPNADSLIKQLKEEEISATIFIVQDHAGRTWYTVRSGAYDTMPEASRAAAALSQSTHRTVLVRPARKL